MCRRGASMVQASEATILPLGGRSLLLCQPHCFVKLGSEAGALARKKTALQRSCKLGQGLCSPRQQSQLLSALLSTFSNHSLPPSDVVLLSTTECWDGSILYKFGSPEQLMASEAREKDENCGRSLQSDPLKLEHVHSNAENELITEAMPETVQLGSCLHKTDSDQKQELKILMDYPQELHGTCILAEEASDESPSVSLDELQFPNKAIGINSNSLIFQDHSLMGRARECVNIVKVEQQFLSMPKERCRTSFKTEQMSSSNIFQEEVAFWNANGGLDYVGFIRDSSTSDEEVGEDAFTSSTTRELGCGGSQDITIYPLVLGEQGGEQIREHAKMLHLSSGAAMLPHPDKEPTGGEDAFFIEGSWVGVADGVGAWAMSGINSGHFARELMWNCAEIARSYIGKPTPKAVLEKAFSQSKAIGSSTSLVAALYQQTLFAVNMGDSGFLLIRNKKILVKSTPMQHAFNFPYQIGVQSDDALVGEPYEILASEGDVLVLGTDGLFDNLFEDEIVKIVIANLQSGGGPELAAKLLVHSAQILGARQEGSSPFAEAAAAARITYSGGKLDDVTAVVSYVT